VTPRPLRLDAASAVYHVIVRGNERKAVFGDDRDLQRYLDRLIRCRERFGFRLLAFVAREIGLRLEDLRSERRHREASRARIVAAYLGRTVGALPVSRMARYFGRDESTLVRGVLKLEEKLKTDTSLRRRLVRLEATLTLDFRP
jgi:hypothetical protein